MSMIIGKRQIVLAALVVALGTAIFLNAKFSGANNNVADVFNASSALGDSAYVSASGSTSGAASGAASGKSSAASSKAAASSKSGSTASASDNVIAQERLKRTQARADAEDTLKVVLNSTGASTQDKAAAQAQITSIANTINTESVVESLIIAKGFQDSVCFINNGNVTVVVKPKNNAQLSASDSAQITDIVIKQTKVTAGNITIIQSK